jgi:histidine triad (HIT) family protein
VPDVTRSDDCLFCRIANHQVASVDLYEDELVLAFLDIAPLRPGHTQIIPKAHVETFEALDAGTAVAILTLAQKLALRMKRVYDVERVAFLFTGGDHPHAHAHVVPMQEKTDITSARYITSRGELQWGSAHLRVTMDQLRQVRDELNLRL